MFHSGAGFSEQIGAPKLLSRTLSNGYLAVSLFFVLSGFIITYSHFYEPVNTRAITMFYIARVARIYPVYLLSLLVALPVLRTPLTGTDILTALSMTQSWTPPSSSHGYLWVMQAWTLSIEAMFYLIFPLLWLALARISAFGAILMALICAALIVSLGTPSIGPGASSIPLVGAETPILIPFFRMAEFGYGVALCQLFLRWPKWRERINADAVEIILATSTISVLVLATGSQTKGLFAVLAGMLILITADGKGLLSRLLSQRWLVLLGGASYALYILQGPVRDWCAALIRAPFDRFVSPIVTLGLAVVVFLIVEQPARRWLIQMGKRRLGRAPAISQSPTK